MGIIFNKTLKCEHCGYVYHGKGGGHVISVGEHYSISQYCCNTCHSVIDLECYSSLKENVSRYIYPDGTEVLHDIRKKGNDGEYKNPDTKKDSALLCKECGSHLYRLDIDNGQTACCPKCGQKSLRQKEIHVSAYID